MQPSPMSILAALLLAFHAPLSAEAIDTCRLPEGWETVRARDAKFLVLGELHGTAESPQLVGDLACGLARSGKRILVGIEFDAFRNPALQEAWKLPDAEFEKQLPTIGWAGRNDGVASRAMFNLVVRLHALKTRGASIDIVAFNGPRNEAQQARFAALARQGPHEAAQAENVADAAAASPHDIVLVLVGDFHARKRTVGEGADRFDPMALRLSRSGPVLSLRLRYAGGTAWNCQLKPGLQLRSGDPITANAITCGEYPVSATTDLRRQPFVQLGAFPGSAEDNGFDGFFWVGPIHASVPAVPAEEPKP